MIFNKEGFQILQKQKGYKEFFIFDSWVFSEGTGFYIYSNSNDTVSTIFKISASFLAGKETEGHLRKLFEDSGLPVNSFINFLSLLYPSKEITYSAQKHPPLFYKSDQKWLNNINKNGFTKTKSGINKMPMKTTILVSINISVEDNDDRVAAIKTFSKIKKHLSSFSPINISPEELKNILNDCFLEKGLLNIKNSSNTGSIEIDKSIRLNFEEPGVISLSKISHTKTKTKGFLGIGSKTKIKEKEIDKTYMSLIVPELFPEEVSPLGFMDAFGSITSHGLDTLINSPFYTSLTYSVQKDSSYKNIYNGTFSLGVLGKKQKEVKKNAKKIIDFFTSKSFFVSIEKTVPHFLFSYSLPMQYDNFIFSFLKRETLSLSQEEAASIIPLIESYHPSEDKKFLFFMKNGVVINENFEKNILITGEENSGKTYFLLNIATKMLTRKKITLLCKKDSLNDFKNILKEIGFKVTDNIEELQENDICLIESEEEQFLACFSDILIKLKNHNSLILIDNIEEALQDTDLSDIFLSKLKKGSKNNKIICSLNTNGLSPRILESLKDIFENFVFFKQDLSFQSAIYPKGELFPTRLSSMDIKPGAFSKFIYAGKSFAKELYFFNNPFFHWIYTQYEQELEIINSCALEQNITKERARLAIGYSKLYQKEIKESIREVDKLLKAKKEDIISNNDKKGE